MLFLTCSVWVELTFCLKLFQANGWQWEPSPMPGLQSFGFLKKSSCLLGVFYFHIGEKNVQYCFQLLHKLYGFSPLSIIFLGSSGGLQDQHQLGDFFCIQQSAYLLEHKNITWVKSNIGNLFPFFQKRYQEEAPSPMPPPPEGISWTSYYVENTKLDFIDFKTEFILVDQEDAFLLEASHEYQDHLLIIRCISDFAPLTGKRPDWKKIELHMKKPSLYLVHFIKYLQKSMPNLFHFPI